MDIVSLCWIDEENDGDNKIFSHFSAYPVFFSSFALKALNNLAPQSVSGVSAPLPLPDESSIQKYLQKSCGLSEKQANLASKSLLHLKSTKNPDQVLAFLKERGFTDAPIQRLVANCPKVLTLRIHTTLQPKLRVFEDLGIVGTELGYLISRDPELLRNVAKVVMRETRIVYINIEKKLKPKLSLLQSHGIKGKVLCSLLFMKPELFFCKETAIRDVIKTVEKLGVPPHSGMFPHAVFALSCMSKKTLEGRIKFLVGLGLSEEEVLQTFRRSPYILATSEKKLQCHMDFIVNTLNYEPSVIMSYPQFFMSSMEGKILPRYRWLQMLRSMQQPIDSYSVMNMLSTSEKQFLDMYKYKYDESSRLYELYKGIDGTVSSPNMQMKEGECDEIELQ
eukprot:Gb_03682 [translate_table: standard]